MKRDCVPHSSIIKRRPQQGKIITINMKKKRGNSGSRNNYTKNIQVDTQQLPRRTKLPLVGQKCIATRFRCCLSALKWKIGNRVQKIKSTIIFIDSIVIGQVGIVDFSRRESAFGSVSRLPMPSGLMARQIHLQHQYWYSGTAPASEWTRYLAHKNFNGGPYSPRN